MRLSVGVKHAANDPEFVTELLARLGKDFRVFCGLESLSLPMLAIGTTGLMNAVANLVRARIAALFEAVEKGNVVEARRWHEELFELNRAIFLETNPIPLKYMMARLGLLKSPEVRLPLAPLDEQRGRTLDQALCRAGLLASSACG